MIDETNRQLILDLALNRLPVSDFMRKFPFGEKTPAEYVKLSLEEALESRDPIQVEYGMLLGFQLKLFNQAFAPLLKTMILEDWHREHEDMASVMQMLKDPSTVDALYRTALTRFPYLEYDQSHSLAVKCLWALKAINNRDASEKLKLLAQSEDKVVRETAERLLVQDQTPG